MRSNIQYLHSVLKYGLIRVLDAYSVKSGVESV